MYEKENEISMHKISVIPMSKFELLNRREKKLIEKYSSNSSSFLRR